jgi:hypothetical protein
MGITTEVSVNEEQFSKIDQGATVSFVGHFEDQRGTLKLILDRMAGKAA